MANNTMALPCVARLCLGTGPGFACAAGDGTTDVAPPCGVSQPRNDELLGQNDYIVMRTAPHEKVHGSEGALLWFSL